MIVLHKWRQSSVTKSLNTLESGHLGVLSSQLLDALEGDLLAFAKFN